MPSPVIRFRIRSDRGDETVRRLETPSAVIAKAQSRAQQADKSGRWTVLEWDDEIAQVIRDEQGVIWTQGEASQ